MQTRRGASFQGSLMEIQNRMCGVFCFLIFLALYCLVPKFTDQLTVMYFWFHKPPMLFRQLLCFVEQLVYK